MQLIDPAGGANYQQRATLIRVLKASPCVARFRQSRQIPAFLAPIVIVTSVRLRRKLPIDHPGG